MSKFKTILILFLTLILIAGAIFCAMWYKQKDTVSITISDEVADGVVMVVDGDKLIDAKTLDHVQKGQLMQITYSGGVRFSYQSSTGGVVMNLLVGGSALYIEGAVQTTGIVGFYVICDDVTITISHNNGTAPQETPDLDADDTTIQDN